MIDINNKLLPTDFSELSLKATRHTLDFSHRFQAKLHLLHVIEDPVLTVRPRGHQFVHPGVGE